MYQWKKIEKEAGKQLEGDGYTVLKLADRYDETTVLENPQKGLYHHYYDNSIGRYKCTDPRELAGIEGLRFLYVRVAWCFLEPEEGQFQFGIIDDLVERFYKPYGLKLSFCITCKETGEDVIYATPEWVKQAGAKGSFQLPEDRQEGVRGRDKNPNWTPDYSDPVFLEKLEHFHKAFSARYADQPFVEEIIVGSVGDWGEGHAYFSGRKKEQLHTLKKHIDIYSKCYPHNQKFVNDDMIRFHLEDRPDEEAQLLDYLVRRGFGIRDDSINVASHTVYFGDTYTVAKPAYFECIAPYAPTNIELEHYGNAKKNGNMAGTDGCVCGADTIRGAMDMIHPSYLSFHGYADQWYQENPSLSKEVANKCGYWYFLEQIAFPKTAPVGTGIKLGFTWENRGVARAYHRFDLHIRLEGENCYTLEAFGSDNRKWDAYQRTHETVEVLLPRTMPQGEYMLKAKLTYTDRFRHTQDIRIGMQRQYVDEEGFFLLGPILINGMKK